jgi:hypothetical protein
MLSCDIDLGVDIWCCVCVFMCFHLFPLYCLWSLNSALWSPWWCSVLATRPKGYGFKPMDF